MAETKPQLNPLKGQRQSSESDRNVQACNDWLRLGPGRSLPDLLVKYSEMKGNIAPTQSLASLTAWSSKYGWAERATAYDSDFEMLKNARRAEAMERGLALDYERVDKLKRLAEWLEEQIYEQGKEGQFHNVWVPDVKQIGSGEYTERVDLERFNGGILSEFRASLDDLAKETGGRKVKTEMSGSLILKREAKDLTDDELSAFLE